jgi:hypothetical protein
MKSTKLILCSEYRKIIKEINSQLRPHGFKVISKSKTKDDRIEVYVQQICLDCGLYIDDPQCCQNSDVYK